MKILISLSGKSVGVLYHYTDKRALLNILRTGNLALSTGRAMGVEAKFLSEKNFFASFTRSRFGGYHHRDGGQVSHYDTRVMITLDGNKLSDREKIVPVDYYGHRGDTDEYSARQKEYEERLTSNKPEIPFLKFIKRVDLIQPAVGGEKETYGADKGKFKLKPNERLAKMLGSIIKKKKKHKIPYAFYQSMDDWAKRRGEYEYFGEKRASVEENYQSGYREGDSYKNMLVLVECLSDLPYEKLSKSAQKLAREMSRAYNEVAVFFNDYENNRKPNANPTLRTAALKIARALQRKGFKTKEAAVDFVKLKVKTYDDAEHKALQDSRNAAFANGVVSALMKPSAEWTTHKNPDLDPRSVFLEIKDYGDYSWRQAENAVRRCIESDSNDVQTLKTVMMSLKLSDAYDVVRFIVNKVRNENLD